MKVGEFLQKLDDIMKKEFNMEQLDKAKLRKLAPRRGLDDTESENPTSLENDFVILLPHRAKQSEAGLILPETTEQDTQYCLVLGVGPGARDFMTGDVANMPPLEVGDIAIAFRYLNDTKTTLGTFCRQYTCPFDQLSEVIPWEVRETDNVYILNADRIICFFKL